VQTKSGVALKIRGRALKISKKKKKCAPKRGKKINAAGQRKKKTPRRRGARCQTIVKGGHFDCPTDQKKRTVGITNVGPGTENTIKKRRG